LGRSATPIVTTAETPFEIGKAIRMYTRKESNEKKVGIVVTGSLLFNALMAAEEMNKEGVGVSVLHMATVKPLDSEALIEFAKEHGNIVTVEEHQIIGGLGGAVAECLGENYPTKMVRVGVNDTFGESGEPDELIAHFGMDIPSIMNAVKKLVD
jgi:transketolase